MRQPVDVAEGLRLIPWFHMGGTLSGPLVESSIVRILVCPDSFTGTLSAAEAADAIAAGWRRTAPDDDLVLRPLSDGGPGFLDAVASGVDAQRRTVRVRGPLGDRVDADYLLDVNGTAWIESATAAGLHLVPPDRRDPTRTSTFGVGELIADSLAAEAGRIVVGVGGTGTSDGGAGMLAALGAHAQSGELTAGGGGLGEVTGLDLVPALDGVRGVRLEVATDVDVPLLGSRGAARGFARQKGASDEQVVQLEESLRLWAHQLGRTDAGLSPAVALGAGAGGGLGAGLIRLGATRVPGIATVLAAAGIDSLLADPDRPVQLAITGEGSFDWQSLQGKVVAGVAAAALARAIPVLVLAGRVEITRREWMRSGVAAAFPAAAGPGQTPTDGLSAAAERAARTWSPR